MTSTGGDATARALDAETGSAFTTLARGSGTYGDLFTSSASQGPADLWGGDDSTGSLVFRQNLQALTPIAEHVLVTEGIRNYGAPATDGTHEGGMESLFTGSSIGKSSGGPGGFPSINTLFMAQATGTARKDSLYQQIVAHRSTAENTGPDKRCIFDATGVPRDLLRTVLHAVGTEITSVGSTTGIDVNGKAPVTLNQGFLTDILA